MKARFWVVSNKGASLERLPECRPRQRQITPFRTMEVPGTPDAVKKGGSFSWLELGTQPVRRERVCSISMESSA